MENASKALVIAGAVLVSILTVATGVQVYNSAGEGSVEQVKQATETMWQGVDLDVGLGEGIAEEAKIIHFKMQTETEDGVVMIEYTTIEGTTWREYFGDDSCYDGSVWGYIEAEEAILAGPSGAVQPDEVIQNDANYHWWTIENM